MGLRIKGMYLSVLIHYLLDLHFNPKVIAIVADTEINKSDKTIQQWVGF